MEVFTGKKVVGITDKPAYRQEFDCEEMGGKVSWLEQVSEHRECLDFFGDHVTLFCLFSVATVLQGFEMKDLACRRMWCPTSNTNMALKCAIQSYHAYNWEILEIVSRWSS